MQTYSSQLQQAAQNMACASERAPTQLEVISSHFEQHVHYLDDTICRLEGAIDRLLGNQPATPSGNDAKAVRGVPNGFADKMGELDTAMEQRLSRLSLVTGRLSSAI